MIICAYTHRVADHFDAYEALLQDDFKPTGYYLGNDQYAELCKTISGPDECTVYTEPLQGPGRRLNASFTAKSRGLQEGSLEPGDSSFVTTIGLSSEGIDIDDSLTAPAFNVDFSKKLVAVAVITMVVAMAAI